MDEEISPSEIADAIGKDLFGSEETSSEKVAAPDLGETSPAIPDPQPGLTAAEIKALPKSWKKELEAHWKKAPAELHDYVYQREDQFHRGIQQYQGGYQQWNTLMQPYQQLLQQHPNVNPVEILQGLFNAHLQILSAPPEEKRNLAAQMMQAYGIDLSGSIQQQGEVDPRLKEALDKSAKLESRLAQLENNLTSQQRAAYEGELRKNLSVVEAFSTAPENKYWQEVATDVHRFLAKGAAADLKSAYELACLSNPAVRIKYLADQAAGSASQKSSTGGKFPNIVANGSTPRKQRQGTIDDTINEIVAKHFSTH